MPLLSLVWGSVDTYHHEFLHSFPKWKSGCLTRTCFYGFLSKRISFAAPELKRFRADDQEAEFSTARYSAGRSPHRHLPGAVEQPLLLQITQLPHPHFDHLQGPQCSTQVAWAGNACTSRSPIGVKCSMEIVLIC